MPEFSSARERVAVVLLGAVGVLTALSLTTRYAAYRADVAARGSEGAEAWLSTMKLFDVNGEANVPTWFSSAVLLAAAGVTAAVGALVRAAGGRDGGRWLALAGILGLLSLDEAAALHERLGGPATALLGSSAGHFAWVVPGVLLAGVVGLALVGFLVRLPRPVRRLLLGAGAVYLGGAILMETLSGIVLQAHGDQALYLLVTAGEESLEMVGAVGFLYAALSCLRFTAADGLRLTLRPGRAYAQAVGSR